MWKIIFNKKTIGCILSCLFAGGMAVAGELADQKKTKEMEDLKERVSKLENEKNGES